MSFKEIADYYGINTYPEALDRYCPIPTNRQGELCSLELIDRLQDRFNIFGEYYNAVREGFIQIENYPLLKQFMDAVSLFIKDCTVTEGLELKYTLKQEANAEKIVPLLVHLPSIENTYNQLLSYGIPEDQAVADLQAYRIYICETEKHRAGFIGITPPLSRWLVYFTKCNILYLGTPSGLNFQLKKGKAQTFPYILKNKKTGQVLPVFGNKLEIHRSGVLLGSHGAEDKEQSFTAVFEETAENYIGHPVIEYRISPIRQHFCKKEWELILKPGDSVLGVHIFWDGDFTPSLLDQAFNDAKELAKKCFPEWNFKAFHCASWLLSPVLNEVLGESAKISEFSSRFVRFPAVANETGVFNYVFSGKPDDLTQLPENTRLQRSLKEKILNGVHVYETGGIIMWD